MMNDDSDLHVRITGDGNMALSGFDPEQELSCVLVGFQPSGRDQLPALATLNLCATNGHRAIFLNVPVEFDAPDGQVEIANLISQQS